MTGLELPLGQLGDVEGELGSSVGVGAEALNEGQPGDVVVFTLAKIGGILARAWIFFTTAGDGCSIILLLSTHIYSGIRTQSK